MNRAFELVKRLPTWLLLLLLVAAGVAGTLFTPLPGAGLYVLMWFGTFPITTAAILAVLAVSWNLLGGGLGLNDLFWHRNGKVQFVTGLFAGLLIGQSLLIAFLIPKKPEPTVLLEFLARVPSLFWWVERDGDWFRFGRFLALGYPVLVVLLSLPAVVRPRTRFPLVLGAVLSVAVFVGAIWVFDQAGVLSTVGEQERVMKTVMTAGPTEAAEPAPADEPPWREWVRARAEWLLQPAVPLRNPTLHALALVLAAAVVLVLVVFVVFEWTAVLPSPPPVLVLFAILGALNSVLGSGRFVLYEVPWELPATGALAILVWCMVANRDDFKLRFPTLEPYYSEPVPLPLPQPQPGALDPPLLPSATVLAAARKNWTEADRPAAAPPKPPLIVLAVSGGGSRSAVWTCAVLEELRRQELARRAYAKVPGTGGLLVDQVRVVTGASGGMVGAAYYAAHLAGGSGRLPDGINPALPCRIGGAPVTLHAPLARALSRDHLSAVVATMLLRDLPSIAWPFTVRHDRGRSLEDAFAENTRPAATETEPAPRSPFEFALSELRQAEEAARVPSLIFSPMLVEDARRLLISNLDLTALCRTDGPDGKVASFGAVEFFKLFPNVRKTFSVATAARMNASFPFVSPAVFLPTAPGRRVVDAGYYDNYGIDIAADWVYHHAPDIAANFSGLLVLELRAYPNREERLVAMAGEEAGAAGWLISPLSAVLTMRERSPWYRNDERLRETGGRFAEVLDKGADFARAEALEFAGSAPLGWSMSDAQREQLILAAQVAVDGLLTRLQAVYPWVPPAAGPVSGANP